MSELTTERLEKRIKNCIEVGNGCVMLPVSVAEELLAYRKTVNHLLDNDGSRGRFSAMERYDARKDLELLLASAAQQNEPQNIPENIPAQSVITEQPKPTISFYRDGIIAAAKWVEHQRDAYDNEHGQSDPDTGAFEFGNDAQLEYSTTLSEIAEGIRSLHPAAALALPLVSFDELMAAVSEVTGVKREFDATPDKCHQIVPFMNFNSLSRIVEMFRTAQPVSEPYKLPSGWKLVPEQATIAMLTLLGLTGSFDFMQQKYKNMLAAAPAQESE